MDGLLFHKPGTYALGEQCQACGDTVGESEKKVPPHAVRTDRVSPPCQILVVMQITNVQRGNGVFSLDVPTVRGKNHYLQYANALNGGWWTPGLPVPGDGTVKTLTDFGATGSQRFYRVWRKP